MAAKSTVCINLSGNGPKPPGTLVLDPYLPPLENGVRADCWQALPFPDNSVDEIIAYYVLEQSKDFMQTMKELYRVCKPNAILYIRVPHASSSFVAWTNPTYRREFTIDTFKFFAGYRQARFYIEYVRLNFISRVHPWVRANPLRRLLTDALEAIANKNGHAQYRCERWWGPLVGFEEIFVILRAIKDPRIDQEEDERLREARLIFEVAKV